MADFGVADGDFEEFALPPEIEEVSIPAPLVFAPWHKPRKQFVRQHQWIHHALGTIRKMKHDGTLLVGDSISYLTLPGPDMIDVRMMAEACKSEGVKLRYTGFCNVKEEEATRLRRNTAQFQIDLEDTIRKGSAVHSMKLEDIVTAKSEARTMLERGGPYLVVNIDACEPLVNRDIAQTSRLIDAIKEILQYQFNHTRQPWLLYLTSPVQTDWVAPVSMKLLTNEVSVNAQRDGEFLKQLTLQFLEGENTTSYLERASSENGLSLCRVFALGIAKWMLHLAEQGNYRMIKKRSFCYSILKRPPAFPNMISTCYFFAPQPIGLLDQVGLTQNPTIGAGGTLPKSPHIHALEQSINLDDLDTRFANEPEVASDMVNQTKALLARVGYNVNDPVAGYDAWLLKENAAFLQDSGPQD